MDLKRGNTARLQFGPVLDYLGATIQDLASAETIQFVVATGKRADIGKIKISKTEADMTLDSPLTGYGIIPLTAAETEILEKPSYYKALKIAWADGNIQEIELDDDFIKIIQNTIL